MCPCRIDYIIILFSLKEKRKKKNCNAIVDCQIDFAIIMDFVFIGVKAIFTI